MPGTKIALVYDAIYPYIKGGAERRYYELGKRLAAQGNDVHLYGMKLWDGPQVIQRDGMTLHGIAKARPLYGKDGKRTIAQSVLFGLATFRMLREDFDVIDCCGFPYFSMFPAKLAAVLKRKPLYASWHEVWGLAYWRKYLGPLGYAGFVVEKAASMLPNKIIACSELTARRLRNDLGVRRPVVVVPNGIDIQELFDIAPAAQRSSVIYVGRLLSHKNVDLLVRALAHLQKQGRPVDCTIVGNGPEKAALQALATKLGVDKHITWTGFIEASEEVFALMKSAKVFVLPSEREGFGMVALEANACGIPVLTLDHPGNGASYWVGSRAHTGATFARNTEELAVRIAEIVTTSSDEAREACVDFAKQYDWQQLAAGVQKEYAV